MKKMNDFEKIFIRPAKYGMSIIFMILSIFYSIISIPPDILMIMFFGGVVILLCWALGLIFLFIADDEEFNKIRNKYHI